MMIMQMSDVNDKDLSLYANYTYCGIFFFFAEKRIKKMCWDVKPSAFTSARI